MVTIVLALSLWNVMLKPVTYVAFHIQKATEHHRVVKACHNDKACISSAYDIT